MQQATPAVRCALKPIFPDISETCVHTFEKYVRLAKLKPVQPSKFCADYTETIQEQLAPQKDKAEIRTLNQFCTCR